MTIFERTKNIANMRKLSLAELERKAGLGTKSIYAWQRNNPTVDNLQKVADVLNVSVDYLLGNTDDMHSVHQSTEETAEELLKSSIMAFQGANVSEERAEQIADAIRPMVEMMIENEDAKDK